MGFIIGERTGKELLIEVDGVVMVSDEVQTSTRTVYFFDDFVIKFDSNYYENQNPRELDTWRNINGTDDKQYFAELIDWIETDDFGLVLRQERIIPEEYPNVTQEIIDTFQELCKTYNLYDVCVHESYLSNCVVDLEGRLKIYDYAL